MAILSNLKNLALGTARLLLPKSLERKFGIEKKEEPTFKIPIGEGLSEKKAEVATRKVAPRSEYSMDSLKDDLRTYIKQNLRAGVLDKDKIKSNAKSFVKQKINEKFIGKITPPPPKDLRQFAKNFQRNTKEIVNGIGAILGMTYEAVTHPIKTLKRGGEFTKKMITSPGYREEVKETYVTPIVNEYKEYRHPLTKLYEDPLDVILDITAVMSAGGTLLTKTGFESAGKALTKTSQITSLKNVSNATKSIIKQLPDGEAIVKNLELATEVRKKLQTDMSAFIVSRNKLFQSIDKHIVRLTDEEVSILPQVAQGLTPLPANASDDFLKALGMVRALAKDQERFGIKIGKLTDEIVERRRFQPLNNFLEEEGKLGVVKSTRQPLKDIPYEELTGLKLQARINAIKRLVPDADPIYMMHFFEDAPKNFSNFFLNTKPVREFKPNFLKKSYGAQGYIGESTITRNQLSEVLKRQTTENLKWQRNIKMIEDLKAHPETLKLRLGERVLPGYEVFAPDGFLRFYNGTIDFVDALKKQMEYFGGETIEAGLTRTGLLIKEAEKLGLPVSKNGRLRSALGRFIVNPLARTSRIELKSFAPRTMIHEMSHFYDWAMGGKLVMYSKRLINKTDEIAAEAKKVITYTRPDMIGKPWANQVVEQFAESLRLYQQSPASLRKLAPKLTKEIKALLTENPAIKSRVDKLIKLNKKVDSLFDTIPTLEKATAAIGEDMADLFGRAAELAFPKKSYVGVAGATMYQVPEAMARQLKSAVKSTNPIIKLFYDKPLDAFRFAVLSLYPRWNFNNIIGNAIFSTVSGDVFNPKAFYHYAQARKAGVFPDDLFAGIHRTERYTSGKLGSVAEIPWVKSTVSMHNKLLDNRVLGQFLKAAEGTVKWGVYKPIQAVGNLGFKLNELVDDMFKGVGYINRALKEERKGFIKRMAASYDDVEKILKKTKINDKLSRQLVDDVHKWYYYGLNLTDFERRVVRRAIPFYSWMRWSTEYAYRIVSETPVRANIIKNMARDFYAFTGQRKLIEQYPYMAGAVPIGNDEDGTVYYLKTRGMNPFSHITDFMNNGIISTLGQAAAPGVKVLYEQVTGEDMFLGKPFTKKDVYEAYNGSLYKYDPEVGSIVQVEETVKPGLLEHLLRQYVPQYLLMETLLTGGYQRYTAEGLDTILSDLFKDPKDRKAVVTDIITHQPKEAVNYWNEIKKSLGINIKEITPEDSIQRQEYLNAATSAILNKEIPMMNPQFKSMLREKILQEISAGTDKEDLKEKVKLWIGGNVEQLKLLGQ